MGFPGTGWAQKLSVFVATGFGAGLVTPIAPGTVGSWPGILVALALVNRPVWQQLAVCALLTLMAVPICDVAERVLGKKDDGRICADEWMLYPIALIGLPLWQHLWLVPVTFVVIRVCDIIKPPPARQLQVVKGGLGIVIDDFFAQLYALAINWAIFLAVTRWLA